MDDYSGKRALGGVVIPKKGSVLVLRDTPDSSNGNAQFCNRLGCSGRLNYTKSAQNAPSEKPKLLRPSFRSSSGKEVIGSSSGTCSSTATSVRKSFHGSRKKLSSQVETDSSESSSVRDESDVPEPAPLLRRNHTGFQSQSRDDKSSKGTLVDVGSSGKASNASTRKVYRQKSGLVDQDNGFGSIGPSASESTGQGTRESSSASSYGLRNLRCNSISDALPQGCSYSNLNSGRRGDILKKRSTEGDSSSTIRGKKMGEPSSSHEGCIPHSGGGVSIADSRHVKTTSGFQEGSISSVRTRRSVSGNTRIGRFNQLRGNNSSLTESSQLHQPEIPRFSGFSVDNSLSDSGSGGPSSSDTSSSTIPVTSRDLGITRLVNYDGSRRYNMDGVAEVLLALERIEQDEELTYEQLLSLETNLFLGGLNFYDQHRDMRLDIDNMSYEELLALEEEMGNVSTAPSEETLSKCLRLGIYQPSYSKNGSSGDDIKCSICQEEFCIGDEIGRLPCKHGYHALCINQWLRLKNWCPICKTSVEASQSVPSSFS